MSLNSVQSVVGLSRIQAFGPPDLFSTRPQTLNRNVSYQFLWFKIVVAGIFDVQINFFGCMLAATT
jgi:hypothetical protein